MGSVLSVGLRLVRRKKKRVGRKVGWNIRLRVGFGRRGRFWNLWEVEGRKGRRERGYVTVCDEEEVGQWFGDVRQRNARGKQSRLHLTSA